MSQKNKDDPLWSKSTITIVKNEAIINLNHAT